MMRHSLLIKQYLKVGTSYGRVLGQTMSLKVKDVSKINELEVEFLRLEQAIEQIGYEPLELEKFIQAGLNKAPLPQLLPKR